MSMVICVKESGAFPIHEFIRDEHGTLIHHVGNPENWHYAATGEYVIPHPIPPVLMITNEYLEKMLANGMPIVEKKMPAEVDWPELPEIGKDDPLAEAKLELYKAKLDWIKTDYQAGLDAAKEQQTELQEQKKRDYDNFYTMLQTILSGYVEVAGKAIDRSLTRASFLETVAAAVGTVYTGVLALTFGADKKPLPVTGIIPAIFLGFSFLLTAIYVGFVTKAKKVEAEKSDGSLTGSVESQRNTFIRWNTSSAMQRHSFLQAAIVSLGVGILLLPIPYLNFAESTLWIFLGIGLGLIVLVPLGVYLWSLIEDLIEKKKKA